MKSYLTEYVRQSKVEGVVVWKRANPNLPHQEYLLESEGQGVFAVITRWKAGDFDAWVLMPDNKDIRPPKGAANTLRSTVLACVSAAIAMEFAGQKLRYEPNPEQVGIG